MTDLSKRLLASIENHGKSDIKGIYKLYPHETKEDIDASLQELDSLGWVIVRQTQVVGGERSKIPNVRRSKKQYYTQSQLL